MKKALKRSTVFCLFIKTCYIFKRYFNLLLFSRSFPILHWEAACILLNSRERWSILQLAETTKAHCREFGFNYHGLVLKRRDILCSQLRQHFVFSYYYDGWGAKSQWRVSVQKVTLETSLLIHQMKLSFLRVSREQHPFIWLQLLFLLTSTAALLVPVLLIL